MKSTDIRAAFLNYFNSQGHAVIASSSLVPGNDPTLLFTNAGMVQFKDVFLGRDQRSYSRAASSQRCVRAGGKHNDLENVGYTARHHTFFEMLGNFSFGDYFKQDAISFAWEFLTGVLKLPKDKLWVTVFRDDDEAADIWIKQIGVDPSRVTRMGEKSNFWQMGDTGPCGPCTEIFFDHGPEVWGGPPGTPEEDGDRYIEIWNLVFMQFDRQPSGELVPLPKPSVDTGMGLERISAVMQHVHSNYEIDLFKNLLTAAAEVVGVTDISLSSLRVIGDHIRSCAFLITDGVLPSNEGRGYVLRRIIRRAIRHGNKLGKKEPFFHRLVQPLVAEMGEAYPELAKAARHVEKVLLAEEEQFAKTLENGLRILENDLANLKGKVISGSTVFTLYDTYGFPADLTGDIARERGLSIDEAGFEQEMENQRRKSKEHSKFGNGYHNALNVEESSEFCGYDEVEGEAKVLAIYVNGEKADSIQTGQSGVVVLDRTPFYAESGGQIGDTGELDGKAGSFKVEDTVKEKDAFLHRGTVAHGHIKVGETLKAQIDAYRRAAIRLNHSATHLMHAALRKILGDHVGQKGSQVTADRLRFDFSHFEAMTPDQIEAVENLVNAQIRANTPVQTEIMDIESARKKGAMALFGEKYGETVRVLSMGEQDFSADHAFSVELCGGTHANRTGDIGVFKIVSEGGVASGVRRIEGVTGLGALNYLKQTDELLSEISVLLKGSRDTVVSKVKQAVERQKELEKEIERLKQKLATSSGLDLESQVQTIQGLKLLVAEMEGLDGKSLRVALDQWKDKLKSAVVVLASVEGEKVNVIAGVTADYIGKIKAGELVNFIASQVGGKGGGRADMAQAGGNDPGKLAAALASVTGWITERLS